LEFVKQTNNSNYLIKYSINNFIYSFSFYSIAVILLISGIIKVIDPTPLFETIKLLPFVPSSFYIVLVTILPIVEIGLGLLMLLKVTPKVTLSMVSALFLIFFTFSIYGTISGIESDCGCFGDVVKSEFGLGMIIRNLVFWVLTVYLFINKEKAYQTK
jgi:hypothetical protein